MSRLLPIDDCSECDHPKKITGNIEAAIYQLIGDLVSGKLSNHAMLARWDSSRGNDWIVTTRREVNNRNAQAKKILIEKFGVNCFDKENDGYLIYSKDGDIVAFVDNAGVVDLLTYIWSVSELIAITAWMRDSEGVMNAEVKDEPQTD